MALKFLNGESFCKDWESVNRAFGPIAAQLTPLIIILIEYVGRIVIEKMTKFQGNHNISVEVYDIAKNVFF